MKASKNTFLFLTYIAGFSSSADRTETYHSRHIVSELMNLLQSIDKLGLEVVEKERDAIFFFKTKQIPSLEEQFGQTEKMFLTFHNHTLEYEALRICMSDAGMSFTNLTLKFTAHNGPAQQVTIEKSRKLHRNDGIVSHRLKKNDVASSYKNSGEVEYTIFDFLFLHQRVATYKAEYRKYMKANTVKYSGNRLVSGLKNYTENVHTSIPVKVDKKNTITRYEINSSGNL